MVAVGQEVLLQRGDVGLGWLDGAVAGGVVACDIETSSLDWKVGNVGTFQIASEESSVVVKVEPGRIPNNICALMEDSRVTKVFHHAPFDLRFIVSSWGVTPASIACTKIAAKIAAPNRAPSDYSLKPTLLEYLGVEIDKAQQVSNWLLEDLNAAQLAYAVNDVKYLLRLLAVLRRRIASAGVEKLLDDSFAYLPARAQLDIRGSGDVFSY